MATSQLPVEHWHKTMANPTIANSILDWLVQPTYHIELNGDSMRKQFAPSINALKHPAVYIIAKEKI